MADPPELLPILAKCWVPISCMMFVLIVFMVFVSVNVNRIGQIMRGRTYLPAQLAQARPVHVRAIRHHLHDRLTPDEARMLLAIGAQLEADPSCRRPSRFTCPAEDRRVTP